MLQASLFLFVRVRHERKSFPTAYVGMSEHGGVQEAELLVCFWLQFLLLASGAPGLHAMPEADSDG